MAEGSAAIVTRSDDASRGRPYYDKLRKDLKETLERKRELNRNIANLEATIARAEIAYLEETSAAGNIIKGFDNYIKASVGGSSAVAGTATRRKGGVSEQDKIFSNSSVNWNAV
jgi:chromatin modification-related protein EAF6